MRPSSFNTAENSGSRVGGGGTSVSSSRIRPAGSDSLGKDQRGGAGGVVGDGAEEAALEMIEFRMDIRESFVAVESVVNRGGESAFHSPLRRRLRANRQPGEDDCGKTEDQRFHEG